MALVTERLREAINRHDAPAMAALFTEDYRSEQPLHPNRAFGGSSQVEKNWTAMFAGVPDLVAEILGCITAGDEVWTEWRWSGSHVDGSPFLMRGVTVMGVRDERIAWARLYMDSVEEASAGIDEAVQDLAKAPETRR